jgi:hypothetical protein
VETTDRRLSMQRVPDLGLSRRATDQERRTLLPECGVFSCWIEGLGQPGFEPENKGFAAPPRVKSNVINSRRFGSPPWIRT